MELSLVDLATRVIAGSSRTKPADGVLRTALKQRSDLSPSDCAAVSGAVFAFYRWFGWLDAAAPLAGRLQQALELDGSFQQRPDSFPADQLITKVVPAWARAECEVTAGWARSLQSRPPVWLRARPGQGMALAEKLGDAWAFGKPPLEEVVQYDGEQDLHRTAEFHSGEFEIQDLSSQVVGKICAPQPGETWWDACAGQGGKTLHLSDLMQNSGLIWATDRAEWRLKILARRAARARIFNYRSRQWDGGSALPTRTRFDGVLVDAPCSGMGTWHRNPHARWTTTSGDVAELSALQSQLLQQVSAAVKPGGKLIYAVCTLAAQETTKVADEFDRKFPQFRAWPVANPLLPDGAVAARLKLATEEFGGNGMFVATWRRAG